VEGKWAISSSGQMPEIMYIVTHSQPTNQPTNQSTNQSINQPPSTHGLRDKKDRAAQLGNLFGFGFSCT
jgi:hypothetical protein